jgi:hypothetical protein
MKMHNYRIHHVSKLLLKKEGQGIIKEYCKFKGFTKQLQNITNSNASILYTTKQV